MRPPARVRTIAPQPMIATIINAGAVILGSVLGLLFHRKISDRVKAPVYAGIGIVTLVIGMSMALEGTRILYLALSLTLGGILGSVLRIEDAILRLGERLRRLSRRSDEAGTFAAGFLDASVLFCVGAMAIVGAFRAGTEGDYELLLTKSILDGFMAILLTSAFGVGVAFSALTVLIYQGGLTLLSRLIAPAVNELVLSEISAVGGSLILMIGVNLLGAAKIRTADFLPALVFVILFVALDPLLPLPF